MKTMYAARRLTAAALAVLCVLLLAAGCARKHPSAAAPTPQKDGDLNDMMTISTRYGDLYFSDQWEDSLRVEQSSSGSTELVSFIAVLDEGEYPLFQLEIADSTNERSGNAHGPSGRPAGCVRQHGASAGGAADRPAVCYAGRPERLD